MKREYNPEKATSAMKASAKMPALKHSIDGEPFDVQKSEVVKWLLQQPEILNAMFHFYADRGAIVFDQESKTWRGVAA